jgi:hypothetical protein
MLTTPARQELHPYHDSRSLLCVYAAYGPAKLSGIRWAARYLRGSAHESSFTAEPG